MEQNKEELSLEEAKEKFCPCCGSSCDIEDNYCWKCGSELGSIGQ